MEWEGLVLKNKTFPWIIILLGLFLISPIPDPSDALGFSVFSAYKGIEFSMDNLSTYFLEYTILTSLIGAVLVLFGMNLLGWDLKRLLKKLDLGKYNIAVGLSIAVVALVALLEVQGILPFSALLIFSIVPICYYFFYHRDKSESISLWLSSYLMWMFGLAEVLHFVFQKIPMTETFPHLSNHLIIGNISSLLGFSTVTNASLYISILIGFAVIYLINKVLKEKF